jgi:hypothetical protein
MEWMNPPLPSASRLTTLSLDHFPEELLDNACHYLDVASLSRLEMCCNKYLYHQIIQSRAWDHLDSLLGKSHSRDTKRTVRERVKQWHKAQVFVTGIEQERDAQRSGHHTSTSDSSTINWLPSPMDGPDQYEFFVRLSNSQSPSRSLNESNDHHDLSDRTDLIWEGFLPSQSTDPSAATLQTPKRHRNASGSLQLDLAGIQSATHWDSMELLLPYHNEFWLSATYELQRIAFHHLSLTIVAVNKLNSRDMTRLVATTRGLECVRGNNAVRVYELKQRRTTCDHARLVTALQLVVGQGIEPGALGEISVGWKM